MPHHLRAPALNGDMLLSPEGSLVDLARANETQFAGRLLWGRPLASIREEARAEVLSLATRWTNELVGPVNHFTQPQFWIMGGHQPELFHPGVWVKNAVVAGLATQLGGVGLHLTVDHDICSGSSVRIPRNPNSPGMITLDWDTPRTPLPWEERPAPDTAKFSTFGERCRSQLQPFGIEPLAAFQAWGASAERGIVDRLVQLRVRFERSAGIRNLELKVSDLADSRCFRRFLLGSLREAATLRTAYNSALTDFRAANRIRSRSHPVPPLDETAQGIEVPFWVWRTGEARRSRLLVQAQSLGKLRLHDGVREIGEITANGEDSALVQLNDLRRQGWKIRPRALALTLFCRISLASAFVHGIGGAKYDELTDALMQLWLGLTPPDIIVATATQRLFERFAGPPSEPEIARIKGELRQLHWNPETVTIETSSPQLVAWRTEKSSLWQSRSLDPAGCHARIQAINTSLRAGLTQYEERLLHEQRVHLASLPLQHSLRSREFAANLFPAALMQDLFHKASEQVSGGSSRSNDRPV